MAVGYTMLLERMLIAEPWVIPAEGWDHQQMFVAFCARK
jgi:hypothetical protein